MTKLDLPERVDEKLRHMRLPDLQQAVGELGNGDCLVFCAGFEARSLAVLERAISRQKRSSFDVVRIDYLPEYKQNKSDVAASLCTKAGLNVTKMSYNREAPAGFGPELAQAISSKNRIWIDISGMSRLLIVQLLVALAQRNDGLRNVTVCYTEAERYPPSKDEFDEECTRAARADSSIDSFISTGVFEVAVTPELSSVAMQGEAIRLIAFPSFNRKQLHALLSEIQPTFVNLIEGTPPRPENAWRPLAIRKCNDRAIRSIANLSEIALSTLDYRQTFNFLLDLYNERSAFDRLVVAPTGSKMQAVAVGLFRAFMHDVQIVYPTPEEFPKPERHTEGVKAIYQLSLDQFGSVTRR